jgi:tetratricopeptide (TPR) repeat protein
MLGLDVFARGFEFVASTFLSSAVLRWVVLGILAGAALGCEEGELDQLRRASPDIDESLARHLVEDTDEAFVEYCENLGFYQLIREMPTLTIPYRQSTLEAFRRTAQVLDPYRLRMVNAMAVIYGHDKLRDRIVEHQALPIERRFTLVEFDTRVREYDLRDLPPEESVDQLLRFLAVADSLRLPSTKTYVELAVADRLHALERYDAERHWRWIAVDDLIESGNVNMTCQTLGRLGATYRGLSKPDSMRICWDRALELAMHSRIPDQAARILEFYGNYEWRLGRLTAAFDLYRQAIDTCDELKGGPATLRFLMDVLDCQADFECWDIVGRDLPPRQLLAAEFEEPMNPFPIQVGTLEGRYRMAIGQVAAADSVYAETLARSLAISARLFTGKLLYYWGVGLLEQGLPARALEKIEFGIDCCRELPLPPEEEARFRVAAAQAHFALDQYDAADAELGKFEAISDTNGIEARLRHSWTEHDALGVRLALVRGHRKEAVRGLRRGFERLQRYLVTVDASAEGYLALQRAGVLRAAAHEALGSDPRLGYALEMAWRRSALWLKPRPEEADIGKEEMEQQEEGQLVDLPPNDCIRVIDTLCNLDREELPELRVLRERLGRNDAHVVYWVDTDRVVRWTATSSGVVRDELAVPLDTLRSHVFEAIRSLATEHPATAPCEPKLAADLATLAEELLPSLPPAGSMSSTSTGPPMLLVSPDGFLDGLSFEALNVAKDGYTPLVKDRDVAYLHHLPPANSSRKDPLDRSRSSWPAKAGRCPGIALVDPTPPPSFERRQGEVPALPRGDDEVRELADLVPGLVVLSGARASRARLAGSWDQARLLYFATHVFRDREAPYLTYMALSAPDSAERETYFDVSDVRAGDLRACDLVVLSACASGAPYVTRTFAGASLADAFLDAGTQAAIQTWWDVRDDDAQRLMGRFMHHWLREGQTPIEALGAARREIMGDSAWSAHPFSWAAYSIEIAHLP